MSEVVLTAEQPIAERVELRAPRISNLGHVEIFTPKPEETLDFMTRILGLSESGREGQSVYLRAFGEFGHHSVIVTERDRPGVGHIGWRTEAPEEVGAFADRLRRAGVEVRESPAGSELGQGDAIRFATPGGHDFEIFYHLDRAEPALPSKLKNQPQRYPAGTIGARRLDHVNLLCPEVIPYRRWLGEHLDFKLREHIELDNGSDAAAWLSVTPLVHDVAVMADATGAAGRLHHLAFWLDNREDMLRAADILAEEEIQVEAGPGKHGISQAFFIYLFEPGGNRIELFSGGYLILEPDWQPVTWTEEELARSIIWWGSPLPDAFFTYGT